MPIHTAKGLGAAALLLSACGGTAERVDEQLDEQSQAITNGSPSSDAAVVALTDRRTTSSGPSPSVQCSGSVIAERLVLTAAHCVERQARGVLEVFFGTSPGAPGGEYRGIVLHRVHPLYDRQSDDNDVALLWLESAAPVAPVPLISDALDTSSLGRRARLVGFGRTVAGGANGAAKLTGDVLVSGLTSHTVRYGPAPGMSCNGDSGGPLFVDTSQGEVLAGIISSGDRACASSGVAARVDVKLAEFVEPAFASEPRTTVDADAGVLCLATCADDSECPHDLVCRADLNGIDRCRLPELPAGAFGASCQSDAECSGGSCVPLGADFRCFHPCTADARDAKAEADGGCSLHAPPRKAAPWAIALFTFLASVSVSRTARARRS